MLAVSIAMFLLNQNVFAVTVHDYATKESEQALTSTKIKNDLKNILLPQDYKEFQENVVEFAAAHKLKSGAIYYEARSDLLNYAPVSSVVVTPDGFYYVGYYSYSNRKVNYITNDATCNNDVHVAFKLLARQYPAGTEISIKNSQVNKTGNHDCSQVYGSATLKKHSNISVNKISVRSANETDGFKQARLVAESIWGKSTVQNWNMNDELLDVIGTAVNEIQKCSFRYSFVPKPLAYGSSGGYLYFIKYGAQVLKYHSGISKNKIYSVCITKAASQYRSMAEMASAGL